MIRIAGSRSVISRRVLGCYILRSWEGTVATAEVNNVVVESDPVKKKRKRKHYHRKAFKPRTIYEKQFALIKKEHRTDSYTMKELTKLPKIREDSVFDNNFIELVDL